MIAGALVAACAATVPSASPSDEAAAPPAPLPCAGKTNEQGVDPTTREEIDRAIAVRIDYGLRADGAFVREMACEPEARLEFGIPLTAAEVEELFARNSRTDAVVEAVQRHAEAHTDEFGGLYIDQSLGGVVTVLWTGNLGTHEAAIRSHLQPGTPMVMRQVRWSERVLRDLQNRIAADLDWMKQIPAVPQGIGVDIIDNLTTVDISSAQPLAAEIILAHYGVDPAMLRVTSDRTGAALLPWGTVRGRVVMADGSVPPHSLDVRYTGTAPGQCGGGDIGYATRDDGSFEYPCQVGRRTIQIVDFESGPDAVVGEVTVVVPADGVVRVRIVIDSLPET